METKTAMQYLQERLLKDIEIFPQYKEYIDGILYDIYNELYQIEKEQMRDAVLSTVTSRAVFRDIFSKQFDKYYENTYEKN